MKDTNWYILRSQSNKENKVCERIESELKSGRLTNVINNVVVPKKTHYYYKNEKKIKREKIIYPGYIFIECNSPSELKEIIKETDGAIGFLKSRSGEIEKISESEVNKMIGQENLEEKINPFVVNEKVKIIDGAFSSMKGVINEIIGEKVKLSVSIFGRDTPVELNVNQINKTE